MKHHRRGFVSADCLDRRNVGLRNFQHRVAHHMRRGDARIPAERLRRPIREQLPSKQLVELQSQKSHCADWIVIAVDWLKPVRNEVDGE